MILCIVKDYKDIRQIFNTQQKIQEIKNKMLFYFNNILPTF
jgi:hypothetical protein